MKKVAIAAGAVFLTLVIAGVALIQRPIPDSIIYGVTFSAQHATEIGLDWREVYIATLDELGVRHLRIPTYWTQIEPTQDAYSWESLDFQIAEAEKRDASVILAVGRRLPRWPECHVPEWAKELSWQEQQQEILAQIEATVLRYRESPAVAYWQVENEPFLTAFANEHCGWLDEDFLDREIALVRGLDSRSIILTDGGNFGAWFGAYRRADMFGTSMYLYFWRPEVGAFRTILPVAYYRAKTNLVSLLLGKKPVFLSELSLEPWLAADINDVPMVEQEERMSLEKMDEIIAYAARSSYGLQYVWGVEWWFWMKERGNVVYWNKAKEFFRD